jgi:hypothetical protein
MARPASPSAADRGAEFDLLRGFAALLLVMVAARRGRRFEIVTPARSGGRAESAPALCG